LRVADNPFFIAEVVVHLVVSWIFLWTELDEVQDKVRDQGRSADAGTRYWTLS
jgi:hypothetical protein